MAAGAGPVDVELKKAFQELQGKMIATQQQLKVCDAQIESLKRQNQHSTIVKSEVSNLESSTPTYLSVGRMFVLTPQTDVVKSLQTKVGTNEEKIKSIEKQKTYLQKSMKDSENNLRELIATKHKR